MQLFGIVKDTWWDLPVSNFWSNKDQVKLSSESPDNSYRKGLFWHDSESDPPMSITPLVVGEVTNVLPFTLMEAKRNFGPVTLGIIICYHNHDY